LDTIVRSVITLKLDSAYATTLGIEPVGEVIQLERGGTYQILTVGVSPALPDIVLGKDLISVYAPIQCDIAVFCGSQHCGGFYPREWAERAPGEYELWRQGLTSGV
jgi:hypothetical protein